AEPGHPGEMSPAKPRIGPLLDLRRSDDLLGLMWIESAGACGPALGQDLHRKQFGVDFGFESARGARCACRSLVRFVRTKSHIPSIALLHASITRVAEQRFHPARRRIAPEYASAGRMRAGIADRDIGARG